MTYPLSSHSLVGMNSTRGLPVLVSNFHIKVYSSCFDTMGKRGRGTQPRSSLPLLAMLTHFACLIPPYSSLNVRAPAKTTNDLLPVLTDLMPSFPYLV